MQSVTRSPASVINNTQLGAVDWINPGNASAADGAKATAFVEGSAPNSNWLMATDFGFAIPADATIDGILVEVKLDGDVHDRAFLGPQLVIAGTPTGDMKGTLDAWTLNAPGYTSYGGSSDSWSISPTPTKLNSSDFGFVTAAVYNGSDATAYVDHIRITVFYTSESEPEESTAFGNDISRRWGGISMNLAATLEETPVLDVRPYEHMSLLVPAGIASVTWYGSSDPAGDFASIASQTVEEEAWNVVPDACRAHGYLKAVTDANAVGCVLVGKS